MRCIASRLITRSLAHRTFRPLVASTPAPSHFHFRVMAAIPPASVPAQPFSGLSAEQLEQFDRDGYLVLPNFFSSETADALKAHADELVEGLDMATHPRTIFKSTQSGRQTDSSGMVGTAAAGILEDKNKYFLDSATRVSFFFEEHAMGADGQLKVPKGQAINKIGHYLHRLDAPYRDFTYRPEVKSLAKSIGMKTPVVLQSMIICKQPRIGGVVTPHRDSTFLHTQPSTATGMWFALEDCTKDNGCLSFVPGSHKDGANSKRFVRVGSPSAPLLPSINNLDFNPASPASQHGPNNDGVDLQFEGADMASYPPEAFVPAEVKKGTLVLIHGEVVHASTHNHSDKSRYIYTFHLIDQHGTTYPKTNWLQSAEKFPTLLE